MTLTRTHEADGDRSFAEVTDPINGVGRSRPDSRDLTDELLLRIRELELETAQLRDAVQTQRRIGAATGMLAHQYDCTIEQAWRLLVRLSQNSNVKVRVLADVLTEAFEGRSRPEDAEILASLVTQLPAKDALTGH